MTIYALNKVKGMKLKMNKFNDDVKRILNNDLTDDEKCLYYYEALTNEDNENNKLKILKKAETILLGNKNENDNIY